jgi:tetratricopeptide (TPR) repeat protein
MVLADRIDKQASRLFEAGRCREAARVERQALRIWTSLPAAPWLNLAAAHANLSEMLLCEGRLSEAGREAEQALALADPGTILGRQARANPLAVLAKVAYLTNRLDEAEELQRQVVAIREANPVDARHLAVALNNLGMTRSVRGDLSGARPLMERAWRLMETTGDTKSSYYGRMMLNLAVVSFRLNEHIPADEYYRSAVEVLSRTLGPDHPEVALAKSERALVLRKLGRKPEARRLEAEVRIWRQTAPASQHTGLVDIQALRQR